MHKVYLLLGANIGDPMRQLENAKTEIQARIGSIHRASKIYHSQAWGLEDQPDFLNQVVRSTTTLSAPQVLQEIHKIETVLGRIRGQRWGARLIDIDILYYDDHIIHLPDLQIPHPYIQERNFTLLPLNEIAPEYIHPVFKKTNQVLLEESSDTLQVKPL
ncbi:MAG TPA: 2-amino-4-hydroxy-6-hydroxymethyldihydropteridine diphosphokinase [Candidatus Sphingobacterium stercorigallinarum]|nr:2-amino-4-hydroxy-6-hydroxymethyldihydropteridine diphosphokinase [Candidatus Sphingobacterium stercorigallinarum]